MIYLLELVESDIAMDGVHVFFGRNIMIDLHAGALTNLWLAVDCCCKAKES